MLIERVQKSRASSVIKIQKILHTAVN